MVDCLEHSLKSLLHKASSTKVRLWNTFFKAEACKHCCVEVSDLSGFLSDIGRAEEPVHMRLPKGTLSRIRKKSENMRKDSGYLA
jgi:hypothetical protein